MITPKREYEKYAYRLYDIQAKNQHIDQLKSELAEKDKEIEQLTKERDQALDWQQRTLEAIGDLRVLVSNAAAILYADKKAIERLRELASEARGKEKNDDVTTARGSD